MENENAGSSPEETLIESAAPEDAQEQPPELEGEETTGDLEAGEGESEDDGSAKPAKEANAEDGLAEIEYEGKKHRVAPELKDAFLRYGDYTQKTMALADERRAFQAETAQVRQTLQEQVKAAESLANDYAHVGALTAQRDLNYQWYQAALQQNDGALAAQYLQEAQKYEAQRQQAATGLSQRQQQTQQEAQRALEQQRQAQEAEAARRVEEGQRILQREIPGWSQDYAGKLATFGQTEFGFRPEELQQVDDPRMIKVLHLAYMAQQSLKTQAVQKKAVTAQTAKPAQQVGATAQASRPRTTDRSGDNLSADEWAKREAARLANKRAADHKARFGRV